MFRSNLSNLFEKSSRINDYLLQGQTDVHVCRLLLVSGRLCQNEKKFRKHAPGISYSLFLNSRAGREPPCWDVIEPMHRVEQLSYGRARGRKSAGKEGREVSLPQPFLVYFACSSLIQLGTTLRIAYSVI